MGHKPQDGSRSPGGTDSYPVRRGTLQEREDQLQEVVRRQLEQGLTDLELDAEGW